MSLGVTGSAGLRGQSVVAKCTAAAEHPYLEQLENVEKGLRYSIEWPRQAVRHVGHDVDCTLQTIVRCVHGLNAGAAQVLPLTLVIKVHVETKASISYS